MAFPKTISSERPESTVQINSSHTTDTIMPDFEGDKNVSNTERGRAQPGRERKTMLTSLRIASGAFKLTLTVQSCERPPIYRLIESAVTLRTKCGRGTDMELTGRLTNLLTLARGGEFSEPMYVNGGAVARTTKHIENSFISLLYDHNFTKYPQ